MLERGSLCSIKTPMPDLDVSYGNNEIICVTTGDRDQNNAHILSMLLQGHTGNLQENCFPKTIADMYKSITHSYTQVYLCL